jgi:site-specific DNA-methyltransferase (adenine-specific)
MLPKPYFQDDYVTIYHADCAHVVPFLPRFDLLLTDPPFGIGFAAQPTIYQRANGMKASKWDDTPPESWVLEMARSKCASQVIWGGNYYALPRSRGWLSWYKPDAPPSMGNFELAWTNIDTNTRQISQSISATNAERVGHPTQKPLAVIAWCLSMFPDAKTVLDPFAGSGTTGRACKDLGRSCILIEREERYCELAAARMGQEVLPLTAA